MKKSLFSFLMVAMIATVTFAFAPFDSAIFKWNGSTWVEGEGEDCGGSGAYCQLIVVNSAHAQYIAEIQAQVGTNHAPGSFQVVINPTTDNPDAGNITVDLILSRKLPQ